MSASSTSAEGWGCITSAAGICAEYQRDAGPFQRGTKHGNYNAWLHEVGFRKYDVLAGIDPDQVPYPDFLTATLGQFRDPKVAYVQSPQDYYNADSSLIARGCDEESRDFYWITQRAYHRFGSPSVIGAHHLHRMAALEKVGGLAPHVADDLLLTLLYKLSGWRGAYIPRVLARGLAPEDWATYIKQQRRWARSLLDVKFRVFPRISSKMSIGVRAVGILQGPNVPARCSRCSLPSRGTRGRLNLRRSCRFVFVPIKLILPGQPSSVVDNWFVPASVPRLMWSQGFLLAFRVASFCEVAIYPSSSMGRGSWYRSQI